MATWEPPPSLTPVFYSEEDARNQELATTLDGIFGLTTLMSYFDLRHAVHEEGGIAERSEGTGAG